MTGFADVWARHHPDCNPVGYDLRSAGTPNWVRFHCLPGSKRYADTAAESRMILSRQHQLATAVLGDDPCWIVQSHWSEGSTPAIDEAAFQVAREMNLPLAMSFTREAGTEFEDQWSVYAGLTRWTLGVFDGLLSDIANDEAAPTIWMSDGSGAVFAPYDGGVDLFLPEAAGVARLKARHSAWLSVHPEGL